MLDEQMKAINLASRLADRAPALEVSCKQLETVVAETVALCQLEPAKTHLEDHSLDNLWEPCAQRKALRHSTCDHVVVSVQIKEKVF